jgi:hypothetical protein
MDMFEYVMVMVSIIVGLAMAHLLQGLVEISQRPRPMKLRSIHLVWSAYVLITTAFWWWFQFKLQALTPVWTFHAYLFVLFFAGLLYVQAALLFPRNLGPDVDLDAFFYDHRGWFFGTTALYFLVDLADSWMKGSDHFASLGVEYVIVSCLQFALCFVAIWTRNKVFHWIFGLIALLSQIEWAFRQFGTVG